MNDAFKDISPALALKKSKRARRVTLRLDVQKRVINLIVPEKMSEKRALRFAKENQIWIREKLAGLPDIIPFENGQTVPVFGDDMLIKVLLDTTSKRTTITLNDKDLSVLTNKTDPGPRIERFLKEESKKAIKDLANEKAEQIGKKISAISIRDTKSRWGSCSNDGRLSFSWRLIFAPFASLDYVVAHEVAHLIHMNHSPSFWQLCEELSTDYSTGKKWIKQHGGTLMRYGD